MVGLEMKVGGQEIGSREDGHGEGDVESHVEGKLLADARKGMKGRRLRLRKV